MLDNKRLNILYQKFTISEEMPDDEIAGLTLEELSFIYATTEGAKKDEKFKHIHFPIKQQIIYWAAVEALKKADEIYVAYTKAPLYPYIDPRAGAWVFSAEDLAQKLADDFKKKQYLDLVIRKLENKMILPFVAQLYYMGVENVIVDNGSHPLVIKRTDILPEPEWNKEEGSGNDFRNAPLQLAMVQFFQYIQLNTSMQRAAAAEETAPEEKEALAKKLEQSRQVLKMMESRMLACLVDAKYLVPTITIKDGKPLPPGQTATGEGVSRKIANLVDAKKEVWLPAFTDWTEFAKTYKPTEWGAVIMSYEALEKMAKDTGIGKIVFNARGCGFRVDEKIMENIDNFRQKKAEFDAKRAAAKEAEEESGQPIAHPEAKPQPTVVRPAAPAAEAKPASDQPVVYGDLLEEAPDMMVGALRRTAKALKTVKRMWLAQRVQGEDNGYLLVVDSSDSERAIDELRRASVGYLDGKVMEARPADPAALDLVKDIKPFYKKGLFG